MKILFYTTVILLIIGCRSQNKVVSLVKYQGKFGFIDTLGKWYMKPRFDSIGIFYNGFADSYSNGMTGIINSKGKLIIEHTFDFIGHFEDNRAFVLINDSCNYIDTKGRLISPICFFDGEDFSDGLAAVQMAYRGKWGYINKKGVLVIGTLFDSANQFTNGKAVVSIGMHDYLIDKRGEIIDTLFDTPRARSFSLIGNSDQFTLGRLNNRGDTIMPMQYQSFGYVQGNIFSFYTCEYYGLADTTGKVLCDSRFDYLNYFADNGLALAKLNGKFGFIRKDCSVAVDFQFQDADGFKYGLAAVKINDKWGFISANGNFVIKPKYEKVVHQFRPIKAKIESMYDYDQR